jgi:hypothetical protein
VWIKFDNMEPGEYEVFTIIYCPYKRENNDITISAYGCDFVYFDTISNK